jgi:hydrogenase maturation protein HypF
MVDSVATARQYARLDAEELRALTDPSNPIVLLSARGSTSLAPSIHPGLDSVGLLLPTTPLHALLAQAVGRPLVCTSGNLEGDPLEFAVDSAEERLAGICDLWLHHDRPITRPIDDSVVRVIAGRSVTIRLARGLAPLPLPDLTLRPSLAVGGHLKCAAAWSNGNQAALGPHVGDQESLAARRRLLAHLRDVEQLYRFEPQQLIHDLHPDYFTAQWAAENGKRPLAVQHHHAHILAGMLEHGWLDRTVLGVAWDGTGYGTDGSIWGGEFLIVSGNTFQRHARLRPFHLPGGEAAIREPWRVALAVASQTRTLTSAADRWLATLDAPRRAAIESIRTHPQFSPLTTSAGRLFDAAAAIVLGAHQADFDGQPAMCLEAVADRTAEGLYDFPVLWNKMSELDWRPLFAGVLADHEAGVDPAIVSMRFHRSLAAGIAAVCRRRELPVVLSGGVFQNRLLVELLLEQLAYPAGRLGLPGRIPPNDGGLAAGQLAYAAALE